MVMNISACRLQSQSSSHNPQGSVRWTCSMSAIYCPHLSKVKGTYGSVSFKTPYLGGKNSPIPSCLAARLTSEYRAAGVSAERPPAAKSFYQKC